ncbi:MAG: acyltransferase [Actinomycetaceae bacterium]|nr:acyltransferase [Actinomycetaceae bacterium]
MNTLSEAKTKHRRIRGLDGLRALAAFLVLGYHFFPDVVGVGFIGVDIFFVLSGFLITALLINEYQSKGFVNVRSFWMRRFRRLLPAVIIAVTGSILLARVFAPDAGVQSGWQFFGAVTGTYNWFEIGHHSSYFDDTLPKLLTNMWSLSVEQQFYYIWPFLFLAIMFFPQTKIRVGTAILLAILSVGESALFIAHSLDDVTRAYVGTDTHFFGLVLGAALAFSVPNVMKTPENIYVSESGLEPTIPIRDDESKQTVKSIIPYIGVLALVVLFVGVFVIPETTFMYPWGMFIASVLTVIVIRSLLLDMEGNPFTHVMWSFLESRVMKWFGERSYGIYLWHWPLYVICHYRFVDWSAGTTAFVVSVSTVIIAHLSYTYIETPIRKQGFLGILHWNFHPRRFVIRFASLLTVVGVAIFSLAWSIDTAPVQTMAQIQAEEGEKAVVESKKKALEEAKKQQEEKGTSKEDNSLGEDIDGGNVTNFSEPIGRNIIAVGDSLGEGAAPHLTKSLDGIYVDAKQNRRFSQALEILKEAETSGLMRDYVVLMIGTNGGITKKNIDSLLEQIGPQRRVVLVTLHLPEKERYNYTGPSNQAILEAEKAHPNQIRVARWDQKYSYLGADGIHPSGSGYKVYTDEIIRALHSF